MVRRSRTGRGQCTALPSLWPRQDGATGKRRPTARAWKGPDLRRQRLSRAARARGRGPAAVSPRPGSPTITHVAACVNTRGPRALLALDTRVQNYCSV